ncbi:hypothetical protein HYZ97_03300 [Candidatus Pacearchaeota archaeon]|nr:hypothetical protein [Candidatus Pacearchaeota archaeon]
MKLGWRVWLLIIVVLLSVLAIHPTFQDGVVVKSVEFNSTIFNEGLRAGQIITSLNGQQIENKAEYTAVIEGIFIDTQVQRLDIATKDGEYTIFTNQTPEITVDTIPRTKIQTGLDLRGGARALVQADQELSDAQLQDLIAVSSNRFNVFGLSDVQIRGVTDLDGNKFMLVEVAGATPADLEDLVSQQGKFEARIGNKSVFTGGKHDIADVCRNDASCAGITQCGAAETGYACSFRFTLYLTEDAAKRHAALTEELGFDETGRYLSEKLFLIVDDREVDSLLIGADLRGQVATQISIQGSGVGARQEDALQDARTNMQKLQTILITGSLPYKLHIVKLDTISPTLGDQFIRLILLAGFASILAVALIIFIRYRKFKASLALLLTSFSEIIIILGVASLIKWNLDLPSIAGILATIGTGVDSQIVILDEAQKGISISVKERIKRALFIIISAYAASLASLLPLYWAGAGLFKGFAITTIIGITAGVFISRPAFADIIRRMEE